MKSLLRHLLAWYLGLLTRIVLALRRPHVIAVAGTINKAFAVAAIAERLRAQGITVKTTPHHFNTDIGLPLAILGLPSGYNSYGAWLGIAGQALKALKRPLPAVLVLEFGINRPRDMKALLRIVKPNSAVITDITQRYRENFGGLDKLAAEYGRLIAAVPKSGLAVLNYDTMVVRDLDKQSIAPVRYFSLQPADDMLVVSAEFTASPTGLSGSICSQGTSRPFTLERFGRHHVASLLIAEAVGDYFSSRS